MAGKVKTTHFKIDFTTGCWIATNRALDSGGYPQIRWGGKQRHLHAVLYESFVGPVPPGHVVRHKCDRPACGNYLEHLEPGTQAQNVEDMVRRGRLNPARGEASGGHKLSEIQIQEIRLGTAAAAGRYTQEEIAKAYGVTQSAISRILNRKTWAHAA